MGIYSKCEGLPGSSKRGGCVFYINRAVTFINRPNLDKRYKGNYNEFEAKWIEIISLSGEKIVIASNYRHPKPKVYLFLNYLKEAPQKLQKKKKDNSNW